MQCDLTGKVALVTGGRGVIGAAIAGYLAESGATVVVSDLPSAGTASDARLVTCDHDVSSGEQWASVVGRINRDFGPVDILCNAAGVRPLPAEVSEISLDLWNRAFEVNATGTLLGCQAVLPDMQRRRWGKIVNIASTLGKESLTGSAAYGASKHAVIGLTQSLAHESGPYNINVNAVCPGPVQTPMLNPSGDPTVGRDLEAKLSTLAPLRRIAEPEDVAALVVFLASEHARNIHGQAVNVDGGRSTHT